MSQFCWDLTISSSFGLIKINCRDQRVSFLSDLVFNVPVVNHAMELRLFYHEISVCKFLLTTVFKVSGC